MPQALDAEKAVIGACVIEQDAFAKVSDILIPDSFYDNRHKTIFEIIKKLNEEGEVCDIVTITDKLTKSNMLDKAGGAAYISELATSLLSATHLEEHARIVAEKALRRMLVIYGNHIMKQAFDEVGDVSILMGEAQSELALINGFCPQRYSTLKDALAEVHEIVETNAISSTPSTGMMTGFPFLDERGGLQSGNMIVIAGATSMGKTSLSLSIAENTLKNGSRIIFYSMEMTRKEITARLLAPLTGLPCNTILTARLSNEEREQFAIGRTELSGQQLFFDDRATSDIENIISSIRALSLKKRIDGVFIDYLQILSTNQQRTDRETQLADMARRLKNLAKETGVWIIVLSQLNRDMNNPVPNIDRLRGSGQVAEAADVVLTIYRPEIYGRRFPKPFEHIDTKGTAMIDMVKGRNIGTGSFIAGFDDKTAYFYPVSSPQQFKKNEMLSESNLTPF